MNLNRLKYIVLAILFTILLSTLVLADFTANQQVKIGLDVLLEKKIDLLKDKNVGIITNPTGYNCQLQSIVDLLYNHPEVNVTALFGPEHGIRGSAEAGATIGGYIDPVTGLPIYSLYGVTQQPTEEMVNKVDVFIFDIQDVGARFYTYIWTMSLAMEVAAKYDKEFIVLDRPNPINGVQVEGPILDMSWESFVGRYPLPIRHGMTVGEIANYLNRKFAIGVDLTVVKMEGWKRSMWFDETDLNNWYRPSPNMPTIATTIVYPATCFIEAVNVSEGRGTTQPFELIGAPWIDGNILSKELNDLGLPGIKFRPASFTPTFDDYKGEFCSGVYLVVTDRDKFTPVKAGVYILDTLNKLYPNELVWNKYMDLLWGTNRVRLSLQNGVNPEKIIQGWQDELAEFKEIRKQYLLY